MFNAWTKSRERELMRFPTQSCVWHAHPIGHLLNKLRLSLGERETLGSATETVGNAPISAAVAYGHRAVTRSQFRCSSRPFISVHCDPSAEYFLADEKRALPRTQAQSAEILRNTSTVLFPPCQGWGRAFESPHPLQISRHRKAAEFCGFFIFGLAEITIWREEISGARVTCGLQVQRNFRTVKSRRRSLEAYFPRSVPN